MTRKLFSLIKRLFFRNTNNLKRYVPERGVRFVLMAVDLHGHKALITGDTFPLTYSLSVEDIPRAPSGYYSMYAVRVSANQKVISPEDIFDLRWPFGRLWLYPEQEFVL